MTLKEKLDVMKKENIAQRPPEIVATLLQEIEDLVKSGIVDKAIKIGATMPEFTLPDEQGNLSVQGRFLPKGHLPSVFIAVSGDPIAT